MRIAVYGGSFNPPHLGHVSAIQAAIAQLSPDKLIVIPASDPPHKSLAENTPSQEDRWNLVLNTMGEIPHVAVSSLEMQRPGKSYTADTLKQILVQYPDADLYLLAGTDMVETFDSWHAFQWILKHVTLAAFMRNGAEKMRLFVAAERLRKCHDASVVILDHTPLEVSSTQIRALLQKRGGNEYMTKAAYAYVISHRLYDAKPSLAWLREEAFSRLDEKRSIHVAYCEMEAARLARHWGADDIEAAEAAILHDITKNCTYEEQLLLCKEYGIMTDNIEQSNPKLLHAKTGAYLAKENYGVSEAVFQAILYHTTGRANMCLLEKIIYMADYIESSRCFEGVSILRTLAYEDLDAALTKGLEMSLQDLKEHGVKPHPNSVDALNFLRS